MLVEAEGEELTFVASISPASERLIGVRMSATTGIAGWATQTKQAVLVDDVQNDPRFYQGIDTTTHLTTRTLIAVPLIARETVVGVIEVINKRAGSFDQFDLDVLEALGSSAAIAIDNAQLFETTRHSQERYRDLFDNSPISIWEQDFSDVKTYLDQLPSGGVNDLGRYFEQHPSEVRKCIKLVKVTEVNQASLALYQASNKEELLIGIDTFFSRITYDTFKAVLVALAAGQTRYECETANLTLLGDKVDIWLRLSIAPDYEATWSKVLVSIMDITALKQAEAVMKKQRQDLHRLSIQLITTQEAERKRLAHELHDEMGQALTAIGLNLEVIEQELSSLAPPSTKKRLVDTISLVDQTLAQIRELSLNLRPSMLDDLGLAATLSWYTKQYAARSNIEVELDTSDFEGRLKTEVEIALYRVVQEALTNVVRHTQAQRVYLRLARQKAAVSVLIEDDGCGFDVEAVATRRTSEPGLGLIGIRERVTALGGRFEVQSQPGRGTRLVVEIPLLM
jgi:signal transduction histidine kinase